MSQVLATSKKATNYTFMGENGMSITILAGYDGITEAFFCQHAALQRLESRIRRNSTATCCPLVISK